MAFFRNGENSIHFMDRGSGEPVLLIHGLGSSGADWAFQARELEKHFRLIIPDLPGSGHSAPPHQYTIEGFGTALWQLLDHLAITRINIIGFSLGGAVAFEMATMRPTNVPRVGLINSLASYRPNRPHKWLETYVSATLIRMLGMPRTAYLMAARLFPKPWQRAMRAHAARAIGAVPVSSYLGTGLALTRWAILDRLHHLRARVLMIAAQNDFTPLAEKRELAAQLNAELVIVRGSRHGTPFDSIEITNRCLMALLTDQPVPPQSQWTCDDALRTEALTLEDTIVEEHARAGQMATST